METEASRVRALKVNPARVVHETIDGEVIVIQLQSANYYSLSGSGREIWELVCAGLSSAAIAERLAGRYDAAPGSIEGTVDGLVAQLLDEELVELARPATSGNGAAPATNGADTIEPSPPVDGPFVAPKLEKYTDMQDFLLIDPIHDVTQEGWPTLNRAD